jgi:hypothetical protein
MRGRFSQIVAPSEARNRSFALCFFFRCRQPSNHAAQTTTHQSARTLPRATSPCPVLPSHHAFFLRNPGRLGPVSPGAANQPHVGPRSHFRGHVLSRPMRDECLQRPSAKARLPGSKSAQAVFLPVAGTPRPRCSYITAHPPF